MLVLLTVLAVVSAPERPPTSAVLPASGLLVNGLPGEYRWEVEGVVTLRGERELGLDRLMAWEGEERRVTLEVRRSPCPARSPATSPAWPKLGYQSLRAVVADELAVTTCKAPDQEITLRFPAGTSKVEDLLLEEADRWEPVVAALHEALSNGRVDLPRALAAREKVQFVRGDEAPEDAVQRLSMPLSVRVGTSSKTRSTLSIDRGGDRVPWLVRELGPHDYLVLVAPLMPKLMLQLIPFDPKYPCEVALGHALKGQVVSSDGFMPRTPPGWEVSRPYGDSSAAFCVKSDKLGLIAMGGGRVPRETWLPVAMPVLSRLGDALLKR
jgi:hypothetical protein